MFVSRKFVSLVCSHIRSYHQLRSPSSLHHTPTIRRSSQSPAAVLVLSCVILCVISSISVINPWSNLLLVNGQATPATTAHISPYQDLLSDSDSLCNEFHKDCHCGSIAQGAGTSLYTRIVYPNSTTVIEEYDEDVPYGYKYLRVFYRCADEENVLVGNNMRECSNGNWIGPVPRCAFNLKNETKLRQVKITDYKYNGSAQYHGNTSSSSTAMEKPLNAVSLYYDQDLKLAPTGAFEIPLKRQPEECLRWSLFPKQVWTFTLNKPTRVHYVRIKLFGENIEDLHQSREIVFDMVLKNISYFEQPLEGGKPPHGHPNSKTGHVKLPIELKCKETTPKASQYESDSYQQKYSANYLVLDFLCEIENIQKSIFEYFFSYDYEVDQLYASVIEVRFDMSRLSQPSAIQSTTPTAQSTLKDSEQSQSSDTNDGQEFRQKIFVTSLCELKLYTFHNDCGMPDIPVSAIVQRDFNFLDESERKTYKYICSDKNQELKGNSYVECGNYGRWKNEFPQCVRILPCRLLTNILTTNNADYSVDIKYETISFTKSGNQVVPNGKYARFSCIKRNQTKSSSGEMANSTTSAISTKLINSTNAPANVKPSSGQQQQVMLHGSTQVICRNGKWIGLESANSNCITLPKGLTVDRKGNGTNSDDPSVQLVSLPVRLIRILFALFIILCLIIVSLLVYMFIFRQQMNRANSLKENYIGMNHFDLNSNLIPTILYNGTIHSPSDDSGIIYSTENNIYERVSLEHLDDGSLYHTIKMNGGNNYQLSNGNNNNTNDNYSDISTIGYNRSIGKHEERENSIYGMEDFDVSNADLDLDNISTNQLTIDKNYNQLDRSSSMFMKANSIYEM